MNVIKVVLAGGPSSGKTSAIEYLKSYFKKKNINAFFLENSAREQAENNSCNLEYEMSVFQKQLELESKFDETIERAEVVDSEPVVAIYDGSIIDCYGFLDESDKQRLIDKTGIDLINAWSRYDAVMFLEGNENKQLSSNILSVYMGHPHLRYIKAQQLVDDKFKALKNEIKCLYKSIELEKKFLIEYPNLKDFEKYKPFKAEIEQIYLLSEYGSHRIRKRGANGSFAYFETIKHRLSGDKCIELENIISSEMYEQLKLQADPEKHPIIKDRYCFLYDGQYFEMDVYPFWNDKAVIELELRNRSQEFSLPPEIKVIKDASNDKKYKNSYLARNI